MEFFITSILAIVISVIIVNLYIHKTRSGTLINEIPGPLFWPIVGNVKDILIPLDELWILLRKYSDNYYPIYKLWICHWPMVNIRHPDDVETLLSSQKNITKSVFYDFLHPWLNEGLLTSTGSKWHKRRKTLTPAFHFKLLQDFVGVFVDTAEQMVNGLKKEGDEVVKDVFPYFAKYSLNTICETAMGTVLQDNNPKQMEYRKAVKTMGEFIYYRSLRPWFKSDWIFSLTEKGREHAATLETLHSFTTEIIEKRKCFHEETKGMYLKIFSSEDETAAELNIPSYDMPLKKKRLAMLDLLIAAQKEHGAIDDLGIREEVDTFIFEGHDTTTSSMSFAVLLLAENKEIQALARAEIDTVLKESNGKLGLNELQKLTYLDRCIKEALRLFPAVPTFSRNLTTDLRLKNYVLPPGTLACIWPYDIHRDTNFWPQPDTFDPDRFLPERSEGRHPFSYVPFSAGPRNCIGQKFAMLELKAIIGLILHHFYLEPLVQTSSVRIMPNLIISSVDPLPVKFVSIAR